MKIHYRLLIGFLIFSAIVVGGCGPLSHPAYQIGIISPPNLSIIQMPPPTDSVWVAIAPTSSSPHINVSDQLQITTTLNDNGALVHSITGVFVGLSGRSWGGVTLPWVPTTLGEHLLTATVHAVDTSTNANFKLNGYFSGLRGVKFDPSHPSRLCLYC